MLKSVQDEEIYAATDTALISSLTRRRRLAMPVAALPGQARLTSRGQTAQMLPTINLCILTIAEGMDWMSSTQMYCISRRRPCGAVQYCNDSFVKKYTKICGR